MKYLSEVAIPPMVWWYIEVCSLFASHVPNPVPLANGALLFLVLSVVCPYVVVFLVHEKDSQFEY